jgi:hypothetical protein
VDTGLRLADPSFKPNPGQLILTPFCSPNNFNDSKAERSRNAARAEKWPEGVAAAGGVEYRDVVYVEIQTHTLFTPSAPGYPA